MDKIQKYFKLIEPFFLKKGPKSCWPWKYEKPFYDGISMPPRHIIYSYFNNVQLSKNDIISMNCQNKNCVNPSHCFLQDRYETISTHCLKGHERDKNYTRGVCRICDQTKK